MVDINSEARLPVDPNVKLPPSVAASAANADTLHKQAYEAPQPEAPAPDAPQPAPAAEATPPAPAPEQPPQPAAEAIPPQPPVEPVQPPAPQDGYPDKNSQLSADQWRHQYLSMKGRYEQATMTIGGMQEQITELGDELMRLQHVLRNGNVPPVNNQNQQVQPLLTDADVQVAGPEMLDLIQRAARAAVMPELQQNQQEVQRIQQRQQRAGVQAMHAALFEAVPDWVAINRSQRFRQWCGLRDVYSGVPKGELLKRAFQAGDAARVIAFFKGFQSEEQATGQQPPEPPLQPQVPPAPARQPAMSLEQLAAPGRAKPPSGDAPVAADKPIFTRQQISGFYADIRRGVYNGREADKNAMETAIFAAQNEGRVRG